MTDSQRIQGGAICAGATLAAVLFAIGILRESFWALAIPVAVLVFFVLGLTFWVGWTILRVRLEPEGDFDVRAEPPSDASTTDG